MSKSTPRNRLNDAIRGFEEDAYQRGWADALKHAAGIRAAETEAGIVQPQNKVSYGMVGSVVESALDVFDDRGVGIEDVIGHGRSAFDQELLQTSVRGRLNRMVKRGELKRLQGRWFRTQDPEDKAEFGASDWAE